MHLTAERRIRRDELHRRNRLQRDLEAVLGYTYEDDDGCVSGGVSIHQADYQYINNVDSGYWQNNAPTLANWGGSGSTNSLIGVASSVGSSSKPGSLSLEIYHLALDTNHVQDFTSCTSQAPSI